MSRASQLQYWTISLRVPVLFRININLNIRKDLLVSVLLILGGLLMPALALLNIIELGLFLGFVCFAMTFVGGIFFLIRIGEIE